MPFTPRTKKYTDYLYLETNPASEDAVREQMDGAVQEVFDNAEVALDDHVSDKSPHDLIPYCKLNLTANQSLTDNTLTKIAFNSTEKDNDVMADLANNQIIVKTAGTYMVFGLGLFAAGGTSGERAFYIYKNGSNFTGSGVSRENTNQIAALCYGIPMTLAVNDTIQLWARQVSGGSLAVTGVTGGGRTQIALLRVGD